MSRRGFLRLGALAAGGAVLAACQPAAKPEEKPAEEKPAEKAAATPMPEQKEATLVWLVRANPRENHWEEEVVIPAFKEKHPNITIDLMIVTTSSGADWVAKVMSLYAAGTPADLHNGIVGTFIQLYAEDKVLELTPYIEEDGFDLEPFGSLVKDPDMCRSGKQMAMPILTTAACPMFYNMDLFDEAGLDYPPTDWNDKSWTWDKVVELGTKLTKDYGTADAVYGFDGGGQFHQWAYVFGGDCWKADWYEKAGVVEEAFDDTDAAIDGCQFWQDLIYKYKITPTPSDSSAISQLGNPFKTGRLAMNWTGGWGYWNYSDVEEFSWGVAPTPWAVSNKCVNWTDCVLSPKEGKNPKESWELIKYLTSQEGQIDYAKDTGTPPTRIDAVDPWIESMVATKLGLDATQFKEVAWGFGDKYMDNWAHYVIRAGEYQQIQNQHRDMLLNNELTAEELVATVKPKMDEVAQNVYNEYKDTPLGKDSLCAPVVK
jgi:multiple sugar transport system substrate-binding protein